MFAQIKQVENKIVGAEMANKGGSARAQEVALKEQEPMSGVQSNNSSAKKADVSGFSSEPTTPLNFGA